MNARRVRTSLRDQLIPPGSDLEREADPTTVELMLPAVELLLAGDRERAAHVVRAEARASANDRTRQRLHTLARDIENGD